jgi:membrane protein implicated in regulation of membrane protease activity
MASGIIYLAIIGMWVAYFLPRWVHNKNEFSGKSVERYKSALRVVASTTPGAKIGTGAIYTDVDRAGRVAQQLMRRRIVFLIISATLILATVGAIMQTFTYVAIAVPATALVLYIAHVRRQTGREQIQRRRVDQLHKRTEGVSHTNLAEVLTNKTTEVHVSKEHWIPFAERELTGVTVLPKGTAQSRSEWQPNEIPVPTYVNAPKAVTPKRIIDLTEPGKWTDEQERLEREALAAAAPSRDEIFDQQLADEAVQKLRDIRAANE